VTYTCFENMNKDLSGSMEQETLDFKCIRIVKDYLKQQATMKCKNKKECTHIYNIRKKHFLETWWIDCWGWLNLFQIPTQIPPLLLNLAFHIRTHSIESKSQCLELTTLKNNSIIEDDGHSLINHHATRCECSRMPLLKGKVVEQASLWMIVSLL
jgi:hypothetical protein